MRNLIEMALPAKGMRGEKRPLPEIIREGRMVIGPELAQRILDEGNYERQRRVFQHHVALLADLMRRRKWSPGSQICFARFGYRLHLVNGQHRMQAVIQTGEPIEFQVLVEDVETPEQIDVLYYRFDVTQRDRSVSEILSASEVASKNGVSKRLAKSVYEAVALIGNGFVRPNYQSDPVKARSIDARLDAARAWWDSARLYEAAIKSACGALKSKLATQGVTAVALVTFQYQAETADRFWRGVAENDGLRKGDPRHTLINDLLNRTLNIGAAAQSAAVPALAWNAFFDGRPLKIIKVYDGATIKVAGTPFDGRRA